MSYEVDILPPLDLWPRMRGKTPSMLTLSEGQYPGPHFVSLLVISIGYRERYVGKIWDEHEHGGSLLIRSLLIHSKGLPRH